MRYFWVCDKVAQDAYDVKWHPGKENLADYQSKHCVTTQEERQRGDLKLRSVVDQE